MVEILLAFISCHATNMHILLEITAYSFPQMMCHRPCSLTKKHWMSWENLAILTDRHADRRALLPSDLLASGMQIRKEREFLTCIHNPGQCFHILKQNGLHDSQTRSVFKLKRQQRLHPSFSNEWFVPQHITRVKLTCQQTWTLPQLTTQVTLRDAALFICQLPRTFDFQRTSGRRWLNETKQIWSRLSGTG